MLIPLRLPKTVLWVFNLLVIFLMIFTLYRLVTFIAFRPEGELLSTYLPSFFLGLRYDLRWISMLLLPIVLASLFPKLSPFYSVRNKKWWTGYLAAVTFFVIFFFAADFGCFSYNKTRLNASALNFYEDAAISAAMLWQSYPIAWMLAGLVVAVLLLRTMFHKLHLMVVVRTEGKGIPYRRKWFVLTALLLALLVYGNPGLRPLQWNAAFRFNDTFRSYLALNPLQNFFTTLKFRKPHYDVSKVKEAMPVLKSWMDLPVEGSFKRVIPPAKGALGEKPNVVLVICESFSMYKSSLSGNPLNTSPYMQSLADSSIFFNRCFTPHFSTARGLFATLTGIPDVQLSKFSTRNPKALDQHTIINDFEGYSRMYFLGGSPSFNNFEGLVKNIEGLQMFTEGRFGSKPVDVWGISDKDLFTEAHLVFKKQQAPFFAIIQTADNHRPFTIPESERDFVKKTVAPEVLEQYGFESLEEYNAFRYFDYCVEHFMKLARREPYFENTLFVFIGDHGVSGNAKAVYPDAWTEERLTEEHVPLMFYAPRYLKPALRTEVVSQIDVLPTIAGLSGLGYTNSTLGRDLLDGKKKNPFAFIILHDEGKIGMVTEHFYFTKNINFNREELRYFGAKPALSRTSEDSLVRRMSASTTAFYETARYMLLHNRRP